MITDNLEKELENLKKTIKEDLIAEIKKKGHQGSGKLEKSIQLKINKSGDKFTLQLIANKYLMFLDDGKFLADWLKKEEIKMQEKIGDAITKDILNTLNL